MEKKYPVGYITINRPEKRNALVIGEGGTIDQLCQAAIDMRDDPDIKVFVIRGSGECFCSGFDLSRYDDNLYKKQTKLSDSIKWVESVKDEPWTRYGRIKGDLDKPESMPMSGRDMFWDALWDNPKPSIAQVHSFCLGAGLWISNECDITYATSSAIFAYPPPRYGSSVVLGILPPWLLGRKKTMEMAFTGRAITAEEAYHFHLVNRVVPEDRIDEEVRRLAESIALRSRIK